MHYTALVIIPPDTDLADGQAVQDAVSAVLAPFNEELEVAPWKEYQDAESVEWMVEHYHTEPGDLAALVPHLEDWTGHPGGLDDRGLFAWSTRNPVGMWDWWQIGGRWDGMMRDHWRAPTMLDGNAIRLRDVPPYHPVGWYAMEKSESDEDTYIATHDLVMANGGPCWLARSGWDSATKTFPDNPRYAEQVADICRRYPDHIGVLVDYHT